MSRMIPQRTVNALRNFGDVTLENYGIDCDLYIPSNLDTTEDLDIYTTPDDYAYTHYTAKVWIEWSPNIWRLRKYGIYTEGEIPILARFGRKATNDAGTEVDVDVSIHSYIKLALQYIPENYSDTEKFEIASVGIGNFHDAAIIQMYKLVPRRTA